MKKTIEMFKKENENIIERKSLITVYGGDSSDRVKRLILWYVPQG